MACNKDSNQIEFHEASIPSSTITSIPLQSITKENCLNVPLLLGSLQNLDSALPLFQSTTQFEITSETTIREKFRLLLALGSFHFGPLASVDASIELSNFSQDDCATITENSPDGSQKIYHVDTSSDSFVEATAEDSSKISYRWLTPESFVFSKRFLTHDLPCNENTAWVETSRTISWSIPPTGTIDLDSPLAVTANFLHLLALATRQDEANFYRDISNEVLNPPIQRSLIVDKLLELSQERAPLELLTCSESISP